MQQLRRLSLAGLALLGAPLDAAAQDDSGTLEVLVEDPSGPRSPDGTPSLTFETRTVLNLERVDIGPGRPVTDSGQRIGTGSGTVITPTVTVSELVTEASVYPQKFRHDHQGRPGTDMGDGQGARWAVCILRQHVELLAACNLVSVCREPRPGRAGQDLGDNAGERQS